MAKSVPKKKIRSPKGENAPFICGIAGGAAILAAVAAMVAVLLLKDRKQTPQHAVEDYYRALVDGDAIRLESLVPASVQHAMRHRDDPAEALPAAAAVFPEMAKDRAFCQCGDVLIETADLVTLETEQYPAGVTSFLQKLGLTAEEMVSCTVTVSGEGRIGTQTAHAVKIGGKWYCLHALYLAAVSLKHI